MSTDQSLTVAERLALVRLAQAAGLKRNRAELPAIERVDRSGRLPLSYAQQRLWFLEQVGGLGSTYHIPGRVALRGELDRPALVRALDRLVQRHESLRTTFPVRGGEPEQRIGPATSRFALVEHDLAGQAPEALERLAAEEAAAPFDLETGPLIRGRLVRLAADDHLLLLTMHHIVADGWSVGVLADELGRLYAAFRAGRPDPLPPLPIQYADYAAWQRRWVEDEVLERQAGYWTRTLAGAPELLELPTDNPRPQRQDHAGAYVAVVLDEALAAGLRELGRRHGTTPFMTLLAGWAVVLGRLSGQEDVVVGTPTANRGRREIEGLVGFFVNTLALRVDLSARPTVAGLLEQVKRRALEAQQNQDIPFEQVVERVDPERTLAYSPLFQVMFAWQNARSGVEQPGRGAGAERTTAKFDLSLALLEADGRIVGGLTYATSLFERATVERHVGCLRRVLEAMAADDLQTVDALPLLSESERRLVVEEWSAAGAADPSGPCIHELFEAQVRLTPDAVALVHEDGELTYAELDARAGRLARHLRGLGVGPEARVGVCLEWGPELVVALLATLKAGGVYVPLDPSLPAERLAYMAGDAGEVARVTRAALAGSPGAGATVRVDADAERIAAARGEIPAPGVPPEALAYLIYTSGSTGRPKGVAVEHGAAAAHFRAMARALGIVREDRVLQFASSGFDVSLEQVLVPLLGGAAVVLRGPELWSPAEFAGRARSLGVTVANLPPAYWREVPAAGALPGLRLLLVGGEALPPAEAAAPGDTRLLNLYGPTEAVVTATTFAVPDGFPGRFAGSATPIGRPLPGRAAYVLDRRGAPVPPGVAGELYLGGLLARAYLGRPGLTADRFVPDPFGGVAGARLYRTGDRARWSAGGELEFLGRADFQVKVRGFRIEPGEIEARLLEHPGVRGAVVVAREDAPGDTRLVAYHVGEAREAEALRSHLAERLPEYMVPAAYVHLAALPLTPSGKVDRAALPAPGGDAFAARGYEAPRGETEQALAEVWSELLGVERVGRRDHFFELGGHSLLAVRVVSRVRQVLGAQVELGVVFQHPVLSELAEVLAAAGRAELPPIARADRSARLPLSYAQQRLWFLEQVGGLGGAYHLTQRMRLRGELDRPALARALDRLVERHETLRTTFPAQGGEPEQRIGPATTRFPLVEHDLAGEPWEAAERVMAGEAAAAFDLEAGPLIRGLLIRLAEDDHVLMLAMHHIVADGWSMGVLVDELGRLYGAFRAGLPDPLPALPIQYADYAAWQRRWVEDEVLEAQASYWKQRLSGAPALMELPVDRPRPPRQDHAGAALRVLLDEPLTAGLKALSRRHGTTLFMTLLAGWAVVLGRFSGQREVVVGTPTANRGRREIEGLIGFFVNTLALRVDLSERPTVARLLEQARARALEAQQNQDIPFEQVVERVDPVRTLSHTPLFQVMFTWQNTSRGSMELPGLELERAPGAERTTAKFDLSLSLVEAGGRIVGGGLTYATSLFERATVERHVGYLRRVLEQMADDDARAVDRLELLPEAERRQVVEEWNRAEAEYPREACVHELFEAQVERTPDAVAVVFGEEALSYGELNRRANRLAHRLRELGMGPDARVGLCVERSPEMVVGVLGVLKAGGAWVPLDPGAPAGRLRYMLRDSAPGVVLTHASTAAAAAEALAGLDVEVLALDAPAGASRPATNPERAGLTPAHLAYVIYTSGSTGEPKGVMVAHGGVVNLVHWMTRRWELDGGALLQKTPLTFDVSVWELFWPLASGARLVVARPEGHKDPGYLAEVIRRERITAVAFVPSMLQAFLDDPAVEGCTDVRWVMSGGEALTGALVRRLHERLPAAELYNRYAPTEATVNVVAWRCEPGEAGASVPIGRPRANVPLYVLDAAGGPVPVGVTGELYIGGVQVARGYGGRADLTAGAFVPDPFGGEPGARLYRTGDLARWRADGAIELVGRDDFQVKLRGLRVEPGEIEARLREHPAVRDAVVLAREDAPGDRRLAAYYVADEPLDPEALRRHVGERLPDYMVPAAYVRLEWLPLTPNGKLDRGALPAPEGEAYARRGYEAPQGETEQALAEIWSELLGVERVGRRDDFFELGGHSLLVVRLVSRVRQVLDAEVELGVVFARPVLEELAEALAAAARADLPPIERADRDARLPLSYAQQRLWFLEQMGDLGSTYHIPKRLRLRGELDRPALVRALDRLVQRHEALRTTFPVRGGQPEQRIGPETSRFHLVEHDLAGEAGALDALGRLMAGEATAPFDLETGPPIRGRLVRLAADDHVLLLTMHHIVADAWSTGVLVDELGRLYGAFRAGRPDPLPALPVQYADYAAWQRRWVEDRVLERQAGYWTRTLAGAPQVLELAADHPRPQRQDHAGASLRVELDAGLTRGLKALGRRNGTTLFMTLLAGWAAVLGRLSGQDEVVVGTPTANRGRREIEGLIGFFVNTLALRVDLSGRPTVARLLERVRARALEAQQNQDIPFEQVVELLQPARSMAHSPLFQVLFAWQNAPRSGLELPGLEPGPVPGAESTTAKFDLTLVLSEADGRIAGALTYATSLFERATVERHLGYLRRVLEQMAADDARAVDRLELLPEAERRLVVEEWNAAGVEIPVGPCIHELFAAQAERTPDAVAVVSGDAALSYAELDRRANRLAHHLRGLGVGPDARVAVCVERGPEMIVGVLATLKAGGAYVPLDPEYPRERLRAMLRDSAPAVVLTQAALRDRLGDAFGATHIPVLELDAAAPAWASRPATSPRPGGMDPGHLAYVIYTSGSTGTPKGVAVPHANVARLFAATRAWFGFGGRDVWTLFHSFAFDFSVWEIWGALLQGGRLVVVDRETARSPEDFHRLLCRERVTVLNQTPSAFRALVAADAAGADAHALREVIFGGEALEAAMLKPWLARHGDRRPRLVNMYGITETTVHVTFHPLEAADAERSGPGPIGRRIPDLRAYLLDPRGEPVPVGAAGELYVGGAGLARGYLNRPAQTAERFVPDPFGAAPGARLYRSGDLARWLPDGTLAYLGRNDQQLKVRGFRIEPGEVEARLAEHPGVRDAVVLAREDAPGDRRLVAYYVARGEPVAAELLRAHLAERLAEHMVPAAYVRLDTLPLTPNGKLDRAALPAPEGGAYARRGYEAPVGETEQALAGIWSELLGVERVGRGDNFFELGGHSLLVVHLIERMRRRGLHASVRSLFIAPTLAALAAEVGGETRHVVVPDNLIPAPDPAARDDGAEEMEFIV